MPVTVTAELSLCVGDLEDYEYVVVDVGGRGGTAVVVVVVTVKVEGTGEEEGEGGAMTTPPSIPLSSGDDVNDIIPGSTVGPSIIGMGTGTMQLPSVGLVHVG